jgi:mono/diheme cytochrome c family protein
MMLRLLPKGLVVLLGLSLIICLGAWNSGAAAGPAPEGGNQEIASGGGGLSGSSPQAKTDRQDASLGQLAQMRGGGMMGGQGYCGPGGGPGRMGPYQASPGTAAGQGGADLFSAYCIGCHPGGGNSVIPDLPLRGSAQMSNFNTFRAYVRNPVLPNGAPGPMPGFSPGQISDQQMRDLYHYVRSRWGG